MKPAFAHSMKSYTAPLEPTQYARQQPLTIKGELSGMVFCPRRFSHIAVMRCGEYQQRDGCGKGIPPAAFTKTVNVGARLIAPISPCPNAVPKKRIKELAAAMSSTRDPGLNDDGSDVFACRRCARPIGSGTTIRRGRLCGACATGGTWTCVDCGSQKKSPAGVRCRNCAHRRAASARRGRGAIHRARWA